MISEDQLVELDGGSSCDSTWSWTQTMNYVGQLAGQVFVQVKELYRGLNPATLSGCIDIIVVRQPDGTLQCSPFHVRFGKMGVLRSREKVVDIEINGEPVSLHMKLGENGEAFFVQETGDDKEIIPSYLATSPILSDRAVLMEAQMKKNSVERHRSSVPSASSQSLISIHVSQTGADCQPGIGSVKKRRKKRRKPKLDSMKREDSGDHSEDEDMFPIDMSSDEEAELADSVRVSARDTYSDEKTSSSNYTQSTVHARSGGEWSPIQSKTIECKGPSCALHVPGSGGLSVSCPQQSSFFQSSDSPGGSRPSTPKSDSELVKPSDKVKQNNPEMLWAWGELPHAAKPSFTQKSELSTVVNIPVSTSTHFRVISSDSTSEAHLSVSPSPPLFEPVASEHEPQADTGFNVRPDFEMLGATAPLLSENGDQCQAELRPVSKTDSPSKKKDKRSQHLGADGIYLDDITELEPEVAALYFPKSETSNPGKGCPDSETRSANQSPQSVSSGVDSGVDSFSDQIGDLPSIAISLCGGLTDNKEITRELFQEKSVSYQHFVENPSIIDDPNLVVKIGSKYYNWATAAPLMVAMQVFQKPLPKATVENIMKEKMPKKGGRWWFSWRGRNSTVKEESTSEPGGSMSGSIGGEESGKMSSSNRLKDESSSSDEDTRASKLSSSALLQEAPMFSSSSVLYRKTLRLTSEQLGSLQLKNGPNDVVFSVTTQYQGTCRCEGTIYLWNWDDKIVISDIDGTITRSDTLGHILPTLGKDWTHQGIARLYHKVSQNGYKFLYCSARAIGMADMTRGYLHWVNERGTMLPQGPVLLSPSSLFSALHREVIEKKPEKFKIQCLTDIKNLFHPNIEPFYAAFGNRPTDVHSYKEVGVALNRIFTVNPKGELIQEHAKTNISSYVRLGEIVDHVFPLLTRGDSSDFPCSDTYSQFTYWRELLPSVENPGVRVESS
ncbi:phosphatidate phosphatase LPIN1 isoform X1 [Acipenser ruthenus]|uniref:phosphatidate phosphatase LPIN1 isoform X1 n=3 Tax=Acipenser ruthenus TaxID=7906 RepID=UPI0027413A93|nr:phosphatidate phosphatase LPIN1 isoform X1 [Acipenser ruthenus]